MARNNPALAGLQVAYAATPECAYATIESTSKTTIHTRSLEAIPMSRAFRIQATNAPVSRRSRDFLSEDAA